MLGKLSKILQMVGSVTKGFASIVKMGQQLWKAYKPTKATFKGIEGIIEIERVVISKSLLSYPLTFCTFFFLHYM
jgi:hypothetical protein